MLDDMTFFNLHDELVLRNLLTIFCNGDASTPSTQSASGLFLHLFLSHPQLAHTYGFFVIAKGAKGNRFEGDRVVVSLGVPSTQYNLCRQLVFIARRFIRSVVIAITCAFCRGYPCSIS